jgi:tol-pal system protein YbgF
MINCKKYILAGCFFLTLPLCGWAEAPVVDDSENFAIIDEPQIEAPTAVRPKYEQPQIENAEIDSPQSEKYQMDMAQEDDGPALAKDDLASNPRNNFNDNAKLLDKVQSLQQEVQELRGQLEVQTHDLKMLQQQQLAFYKDLDARLANSAGKSAVNNAPPTLSMDKPVVNEPVKTVPNPAVNKIANNTVVAPVATNPASRINPADEQISYLAAYELVKNKRYDEAVNAMQAFSKKYPQGGYTANAEYWLGELYMVKKLYSQAVEHFDVVLKKFPSSSKSAASLLKTGYAYAALGNNIEARKRLQEVVKNYPGTPTAQLANLKLEAINAT